MKAIISLLSILFVVNAYGQEAANLTGTVISELDEPIEGAVVTVDGTMKEVSKADGTFSFDTTVMATVISVWAPGYFPVEQLVNGRTTMTIMLVKEDKYKYNETVLLPFSGRNDDFAHHTAATTISKKDFVLGAEKIDRAMMGQVAGLQVKQGSGMPGEGSYWNLRGVRTLIGDNAPLIVVDGVPYMPDKSESRLIGGYTRDIFQAYNIQDIQHITVLKGAEASLYGSLGSNGVILVETDGTSTDDLNTRVSYFGQTGLSWNNRRLPLLSGAAYRSYLTEVAMTYFGDMNALYSNFPFLQEPNDPRYMHLFNNETDWQNLIYRNTFSTDNLIRIEGGDAIAKYDLSLGYLRDNGIIDNTSLDRYHARLNADILVSPKVDINLAVGLAYLNGMFQEQGMNPSTNPLIAAPFRSPVLSPYNKDIDGNILSSYSPYYFGDNTNLSFAVSNPLAIVRTLDARNRQYDLNIKTGISYRPTTEWSVNGTFGIFYNYNNEHLFVPGMTDNTIIPVMDGSGTAYNSVKDGVAETFNLFYDVNARFSKSLAGRHRLDAFIGTQMITTKNEYDAGRGRNTPNDFYQTLTGTTAGQRFFGYLHTWNWMNFYAHADYTFNNMIRAGVNVSVDGASSTGVETNRFFTYPSVSLAWLGKGWEPIQNSTYINELTVRASYGITGNTRFSSTLAKYYYNSIPYDDLSTIARANVPNQRLRPEQNTSLNIGVDVGVLRNRLNLSFDYYNNQISHMIAAKPVSSIYGSVPYYDNIGEMANNGVEVAWQASLIRIPSFEWIVGGNIARARSKVKSLGGVDEITHHGQEGMQLITKVGEAPYQFYGYETVGVFATQAEADAADLINPLGTAYQAGDMQFVDQNGDHLINEKDRIALGSAMPDFFGGFYTRFRYKSFALSAEFMYSKGNKAYNAVRRQLESMNTMTNQSEAVLNRWTLEGQITDIPRVAHNDPTGNAVFSERWIEDASYLRMRNITFSYDFQQTFLRFFRSGTLYVTAENMLTFTKYLGLDPEFSYSYAENLQGLDYAKSMQPKSVKIGANLKF